MAAITENNGSSACNPLFHCKPEEEEEEEGGNQQRIATRERGKEKKIVQNVDNKMVEIVSFV